jgi:hypothetical protein
MSKFQGSYRVPHDSRPKITVEFQDQAAMATPGFVAIDFAVGEPGRERIVLKVSTPGTYTFPEVVKADVPISIRPATGVDMVLRIKWEEAK